MSTDVSNAPPSPDGTKNIRVLIDRTPELVSRDNRIAQLENQLGKMQQYNEALLIEHKKEFVESEPKKAPEGGDTASYESNSHRVQFPIDIANSDIDPSWIKGKTEAEVIALTEELAKDGNVGCQKIIDKLTKRVIKNGINMEFRGNAKNFLRSPLPISDNLPVDEQERRKKANARLTANRQNWVNLNED